ncbi:hypothetical protein BCF46_0160 [Litoreibacter meonggei]|uniref:Uncharacterized protein n=1 Tax=Litoreibacter meonggei TaxID=1049199 RepID=A0A497WTH9_9RHOB|nr:hypothetical protein BCF46_0160 [Litoreibacter meonggei]
MSSNVVTPLLLTSLMHQRKEAVESGRRATKVWREPILPSWAEMVKMGVIAKSETNLGARQQLRTVQINGQWS